MLPGDAAASKLTDNPLSISWHDSAWVPLLNPTNVMDYFSERSNPFYDKQCNNEVLKMQRVVPTPEQLQQLQGLEYALLHVQEPILYVIRKQFRHSPVNVNPLADYYIVAGTVYQAPDLGSVFNSRLLTAVNHLQSAFEEARSYARYHPTKGYTWDFGGSSSSAKEAKAKEEESSQHKSKKKSKRKQEREKRAKEEPSSLFQRRRVDMLLDLLTRKFGPVKSVTTAAATGAATANGQQQEADKDTPQAAVVKTEAAASQVATAVKREATSAPRSNDSKKPKNA